MWEHNSGNSRSKWKSSRERYVFRFQTDSPSNLRRAAARNTKPKNQNNKQWSVLTLLLPCNWSENSINFAILTNGVHGRIVSSIMIIAADFILDAFSYHSLNLCNLDSWIEKSIEYNTPKMRARNKQSNINLTYLKSSFQNRFDVFVASCRVN